MILIPDRSDASSPPDTGSRRTGGSAATKIEPLRVAAIVALLAAGLLLLVPTARADEVAWGFGGDGPAFDTHAPFAFDVIIDTEQAVIESTVGGVPGYHGELAGLEFTLTGNSGTGLVSLEARDPGGELVVGDIVGPDHYFQYPPDPLNNQWLRVTAAAEPNPVREPGATVTVFADVENPAANLTAVHVAWIGAEPLEALRDDHEPAATVAPEPPAVTADTTGLPRCASLTFPLTLERGQHVVCTYPLSIEGRQGETREIMAEAATDRTESGIWSSDPIAVEIVASDAPLPPVTTLASSPGYGDVVRPEPVVAGISTTSRGRHSLRVEAASGSADFRLSLWATRHGRTWPWQESGPGFALGLAFLGSGLAGLIAGYRPVWRRVAAATLLACGLAVPTLLAVTTDHTWYWKPYSHLVWVAALALPYLATRVLLQASHPRRLRRGLRAAGWLMGTVTGLLVFIATVSSYAYGDSWVGGAFPSSYNGDYMGMGIHVLALELAAPLLAVTAAILSLAGTAPGSGGSKPWRSRAARP